MQSSAISDLTASLILDVSSEEDSINVDTIDEGRSKVSNEFFGTRTQKIIAVLAFLTVTSNLVALFLTLSILPIINGVLALIFGYLCVRNERDIIKGTPEYHAFSRQKAKYHEVKTKNLKMKAVVAKLKGEARGVEGMESKLRRHLLMSDLELQDYINLVKDKYSIGFKLKTTMYDISCNTILNMIMEEDLSHTDRIEGSEVDMLIYKMKNLEFLDINEYKLRNYLAFHKGDVYKMMENLKSIVKVQQNEIGDHIGVVTIKTKEFLVWLKKTQS